MNSTNQFRNLLLCEQRRHWRLCLRSTIVVSQPAQAQTFKVIHNFTGGQDGQNPFAGVTLDKAGNLYGTAYGGGT